MYEIVEDEYNQFLQDMADGSMIFGRYIDESEYEGEYSHNDIDEAQDKFIKKVTQYLHENYPGKYVTEYSLDNLPDEKDFLEDISKICGFNEKE